MAVNQEACMAGEQQTKASNEPAAENEDDRDRRRRPGFRALIDEMLDQIRAVARTEQWTPEARAQAEADLDRIMSQVRRAASSRTDH